MDQKDFRALLAEASKTQDDGYTSTNRKRAREEGGSRSGPRGSTFLAPRRVKSKIDPFAVAKVQSDKRLEKSKSSKSLLAPGYVDRVKERSLRTDKDDKQREVDVLKDLLQRKEISQTQYVERIQAMSEGDLESSGLVRGLDFKLLARVRAGEDVLGVADETAAEAGLEAALERVVESSGATSSATTRKETNVAAALRARQEEPSVKQAQVSVKQTESPTASKFERVRVSNADGTTTETYEQDGKKVKIIRDASGKIVKKLIKKAKGVVSNGQKDQSSATGAVAMEPVLAANLEAHADKKPSSQVEDPVSDEDIFENLDGYDPFSTIVTSVSNTGDTTHRDYFSNLKTDAFVDNPNLREDPIEATQQPMEEFETHGDALVEATALLDRQRAAADQLKLKARQDAGFGLVFNDDAYAIDVQETVEDEELDD